MAELAVFAQNNTNPDAVDDRLGAWKRGMIVAVVPDGHVFTATELAFVVIIRVPGIPQAKLEKYLAAQIDDNPIFIRKPPYRRRLWQIQWSELPAAARTKLTNTRTLTIAPSGGDYTWAQVRGFFARLDDGSRESTDAGAV